MNRYNLFLDQTRLLEDALHLIKQIFYFKEHKYSNELISKKLNLSYLDWSVKPGLSEILYCGRFTIGYFGTHDIEILFSKLIDNKIGFEVILSNDNEELTELLIYDTKKLIHGKNWKIISH